MLADLQLIVRLLAALIVLGTAIIGFLAAWKKFKTWQKRKILVENEYAGKFLGQFNKKEIEAHISGYVVPKCAPADPTHKDGEEYLADIRENIFEYMDKNIQLVERSYHLLLADTGMGKTMFCLNYFSHASKKFSNQNFCLVSLSSESSEKLISNVINKAETVLIADAFDEDPKGFGRGRDRLREILELSSDFKCVIITCRSQYFLSDDAIPRETPLARLVPRQLGQSPTFALVRSYISPFSPQEIDQYLDKHFPVWAFWRWSSRKEARELIKAVPDLVHRPMLLERLPELAKTPTSSTELYELYDSLIEGWLIRESRWIKLEELKRLSLELALLMYQQFKSRNGRITPDEVVALAERILGDSPNWKQLTARSLLNRDSQDNFKFAHKSILEFLVVKAAIGGDDRALEVEWTPFMKDLFISWGHSTMGRTNADRARFILGSDQGRKNISPLFDMLGTTAVNGIPDFKQALERKFTSTGDRFAPASWRKSSLVVFAKSGNQFSVIDHEFNLEWSYLRTADEPDLPPISLVRALNFDRGDLDYKLPSFEQFLTLVEGLYRIGSPLLAEKRLYLLEDNPGRHLHLLAQINGDPSNNDHLRIVCRSKRLAGTSVDINCYVTGAPYAPNYAELVEVEQLKVREPRTRLL